MDEFRTRLGEQVNLFSAQAAQVEAWDRKLIEQRDRALTLHESTARLKRGAASLNAELELVLQRQDELHAALTELERRVASEVRVAGSGAPSERQAAYELAEEVDKELGEMRETLTDAVEALNGARAAEAAEPPDAELARTVRVLDVHLSAFKWLDEQAGGLDEDLRRVDALMADEAALSRLAAAGGGLA
mmetsp:Transcript_4706/g.15213  ORF Transcript_4706/g.15213 Transcript_4706/m.15213 type:complete len:190 (+) Transcript_4706:383-952(+)